MTILCLLHICNQLFLSLFFFQVLDKLRVFFSGYNEYSPTAIVLMGNFLSKPYGSQHSRMLRNKFQELAELLTQFENLVRDTLIIIVPGSNDSPFANILPR